MKFNIRREVWILQPHKFLQAFSQPGNREHQLWSFLCRLSLERQQDPLLISSEELATSSGLDEANIRQMLEIATNNGSAKLENPED